MILRLQSVEELELLQSRIKAKSTSIKGHVTELRTNTGTKTLGEPNRDVSAGTSHSEPDGSATKPAKPSSQGGALQSAAPIQFQDASRKPQKAPRATFEHQLLGRQLTQAGIAYREEFRFEPKRRWRFDFLVDNYGIEIDGGLWIRGRHSRGTGQLGDMEKLNHAALLGYRVLRFSPDQIKSGEAIGFIERVMAR